MSRRSPRRDWATAPLYPLPTRDPIGGGELIVTRLEGPHSGVVLEGRFSLGWIGALTPEQLEFAGQLLRHRGNVQRLAGELNVAYNTARGRLDAIVAALGADPEPGAGPTGAGPTEDEVRTAPSDAAEILDLLAAGEVDFETALRRLRL
jgi:hypothetical protein